MSTSQSAVLHDKKAHVPSAFDLRSWQGLTEVLKRGKESLGDPRAYSEFRNLVLEYAQKGGDPEIRKKIDATIATFKKQENPKEVKSSGEPEQKGLSASKKEEKSDVTNFGVVGVRRATPRFHAPNHPEPVQEAEVAVEEVAVAVEDKTPEPPAAPEPVPTAPPAPLPEVSEAPAVAPVPKAEFKTLEEYKARIAEIKRLVNAQVGNPATLIDTHNDLGKKYMTALLTALKATGGGGEGVDAAMAALEGAFTALIGYREVEPAENVPEAESIPEKEQSEEVPLAEVQEVSPSPEESEPEPPPLPEERESEPPAEPLPPPVPAPSRDDRETVTGRADEKIRSVMAAIERNKPQIGIGSFFASGSLDEETPPAPTTKQAARAEALPSSNRHVLKGIGRKSPDEVKAETGIDTGEVTAKQTELSSPEVTAMLHQLLHEWSIFEGSGFFGMGPSGPDHPLYQTLAPLSMGEVIAGRWEGSNYKLTKTIKQYVDAWRHEQGIAYVINETFEHYLRRVVQRIMRRQQG